MVLDVRFADDDACISWRRSCKDAPCSSLPLSLLDSESDAGMGGHVCVFRAPMEPERRNGFSDTLSIIHVRGKVQLGAMPETEAVQVLPAVQVIHVCFAGVAASTEYAVRCPLDAVALQLTADANGRHSLQFWRRDDLMWRLSWEKKNNVPSQQADLAAYVAGL
jgi:hypothetical protein